MSERVSERAQARMPGNPGGPGGVGATSRGRRGWQRTLALALLSVTSFHRVAAPLLPLTTIPDAAGTCLLLLLFLRFFLLLPAADFTPHLGTLP